MLPENVILQTEKDERDCPEKEYHFLRMHRANAYVYEVWGN